MRTVASDAREDGSADVPRALVRAGDWSWRILVAAAAAVLIGYVLLKLAVVVVPVLLALFLAAVLEPLAAGLRRRGWAPALAAAVVFVGFLVVVVAAVAWISTSVAGELGEVGDKTERGLQQVREFLQDRFDLSEKQLERVQDQITSTARTGGSGGVARQVIGGARLAVQVVGGLVLTLFTLFFIVKDGHAMADWLQARIPERYRRDLAVIAAESAVVMRQYLKATALTALIDAVLIGAGLWIVGVPLVLPLALLTFLGGFIPIIGAFVAGLLAALVALVSNGPADALIVVAIAVAVQQVEGNLLQPFILGPAVRLHELVTVLAVAAGLAVGGVLGAFLSVPLVAIIVKVAHDYREQSDAPRRTEPQPGPAGLDTG